MKFFSAITKTPGRCSGGGGSCGSVIVGVVVRRSGGIVLSQGLSLCNEWILQLPDCWTMHNIGGSN